MACFGTIFRRCGFCIGLEIDSLFTSATVPRCRSLLPTPPHQTDVEPFLAAPSPVERLLGQLRALHRVLDQSPLAIHVAMRLQEVRAVMLAAPHRIYGAHAPHHFTCSTSYVYVAHYKGEKYSRTHPAKKSVANVCVYGGPYPKHKASYASTAAAYYVPHKSATRRAAPLA